MKYFFLGLLEISEFVGLLLGLITVIIGTLICSSFLFGVPGNFIAFFFGGLLLVAYKEGRFIKAPQKNQERA